MTHPPDVYDTPLPVRVNEKEDTTEKFDDPKLVSKFRSLMGNLLFVSRDSRPDAAFAGSLLAKFTHRLSSRAFKLMDRTFKYLQEHPLQLPMPAKFISEGMSISMYVDASMGNNEAPHGTTGWVVLINGFPIAWRSKTQTRVSRSSMKAELIAMHDAVDYLEWLTAILKDLGIEQKVTLFTDSKDLELILKARHPRSTERADMKRILELRKLLGTVPLHAFLDAAVEVDKVGAPIQVKHIPGADNPADALTKAANLSSIQTLIQTVMQRNRRRTQGREDISRMHN